MFNRIFVGYRLQVEWKGEFEEQLAPLLRILYKGKEFVGLYSEGPLLSFEELEALVKQVNGHFALFFPQLRIDPEALVVFPQPFFG